MPATSATMFAVVREGGYGKRQFISVPWVTALLDPQEVPRRYYALAPDEPLPVMPRRRRYEDDDSD